jgi:hypothetical protein
MTQTLFSDIKNAAVKLNHTYNIIIICKGSLFSSHCWADNAVHQLFFLFLLLSLLFCCCLLTVRLLTDWAKRRSWISLHHGSAMMLVHVYSSVLFVHFCYSFLFFIMLSTTTRISLGTDHVLVYSVVTYNFF